MGENPRKKIVGMIPAGSDDFIELCQIDFSNPEKLLTLKPATWPGDDPSWVLSASCFGIGHSWNHDFQEYVKREAEADRLHWSGREDFLRSHFGKAGEECQRLTRGDWQEIIAFFAETNWKLEELGAFGEWMKAAKIHPQHAKEIIKEFLED